MKKLPLNPMGFIPLVSLFLLGHLLGAACEPVRTREHPDYTPANSSNKQMTSIGPFGGYVSALIVDPRDSATLYAGTSGAGVFKSTNGGNDWFAASAGLTNERVRSLTMGPRDSNTVYALTGSWFGLGDLFKSTNGGSSWSLIIPEPSIGGSAQCLVIDPNDPSIVYVSAERPGILKSTDAGKSWLVINKKLPTRSLTSFILIFDPNNRDTLYAGGLDGIFKTTNGGAQWFKLNPKVSDIRAIVIDPRNSNTIYVGTREGLFKSTDGGASMSKIGGFTTAANWLAIDPTDSNTIYASIYGHHMQHIWKSTNAGADWTRLAHNRSTSWLVINPTDSQTVYAGGSGSIFKSIDGGKAWFEINTGLANHRIKSIAVDPKDARSIYVGTGWGPAFRSTDKGKNWSAIETGLPGRIISDFLVDFANSTLLYAARREDVSPFRTTILKSTDNGKTWLEIDLGSGRNEIGRLKAHPADPNLIFAAPRDSHDKALFRSTDGGTHWSPLTTGIDSPITALAMDPKNMNIVYAGTLDRGGCLVYQGGLFKSTDGGTSWAAIGDDLSARGIEALAVDPNSPNTIYVSVVDRRYDRPEKRGLFKSSDGGKHWSLLGYVFKNQSAAEFISASGVRECPLLGPVLDNGLAGRLVSTIAINPKHSNILYVGTPEGIFKSTDSGDHWSRTGFAGLSVISLAIDPSNANTIYAGTEDHSLYSLKP